MINLIIKDGLGNQMFQYAYARYLQELYRQKGQNEDLVINPYFIQNRVFNDNDHREMSLQHLKLHPDICIQSVKEQKKSMHEFKLKTLKSCSILDLYNWRVKKRKPLGKNAFLNRAKHGIYYTFSAYTNYGSPLAEVRKKFIFGFFQDENNFKPIADTVKKELRVKSEPCEKNRRMVEEIKKKNAVCVHIRRGDYLNPRWKNLQICTFEYYNNAINQVLERVENPVFFIFSNTHDDLEWIKKNYHFKNENGSNEIKLTYVDLSNPDYEELRLMYNCKHFIISNSTFSWWGAYLSNFPEKLVFVPERWNLAVENDHTIYLAEWIKVRTK